MSKDLLGRPSALPKSFMLKPTGGALQVVHATRCVGYVWTERDRWWARSRAGELLDTGSGHTVAEAVSALFQRYEPAMGTLANAE